MDMTQRKIRLSGEQAQHLTGFNDAIPDRKDQECEIKDDLSMDDLAAATQQLRGFQALSVPSFLAVGNLT
jgi:hypothetical protein